MEHQQHPMQGSIQPIILQHQQSSLTEKGARIAETTQANVQIILSIINNVANLNRHSEISETATGVSQEHAIVHNFDEEVRRSASATLIVANSRLQDILRDDNRWKIQSDTPQKTQAIKNNGVVEVSISEIPEEVKKAQENILIEKAKAIVSTIKNARKMDSLNVRKTKAEVILLEKKAKAAVPPPKKED